MEVGTDCYILVNNAQITKVTITKKSGNLYTVKFKEKDTVICIPKHRIYSTIEMAQQHIPKRDNESNNDSGNRRPELH